MLVKQYEEAFRKRIKGANFDESRRFIGIGPEYKQLLLSILLIQKDDNKARQFICHKLGISSIAPEIELVLKRPLFADGRLKFLKAEGIEDFDPRTHFWGADGITRDFLVMLIGCVKGEFNHRNVYNQVDDLYKIPINIALLQNLFPYEQITDFFRQFDNLKTLGMLAEVSIPLQVTSGIDTTIAHFSDGHFRRSIFIPSSKFLRTATASPFLTNRTRFTTRNGSSIF